MAELKERIFAELENIDQIMDELKRNENLSDLSNLELAGIGTLIHNFYNGIENIIKQIFISEGKPVPSGTFWHKDLLESACQHNFIDNTTKMGLGPLLAFRHFFVHGYSLNLRADLLLPLVHTLPDVYKQFTSDLRRNNFILS